MDEAKTRALIAFGIILFGFIIYQSIGYFVKKRTNAVKRHYSKSYDLCRIVTKCSDHSYTGTDKSSPNYITGKEASEKNCKATKTNLSWRKNFQCQYNDISEISSCHDCLDPEFNDDGKLIKCGDRKHDLNSDGGILPSYSECLNMFGTSDNLNMDDIEFSYGLKLQDDNDLKNPDRFYKGVTNEWWDKHPHLYQCLTSKDTYLNDDWNADKHENFSSSNYFRLLACSACYNKHKDNKDEYNKCMNEQADCYKNYWPINSTCNLLSEFI